MLSLLRLLQLLTLNLQESTDGGTLSKGYRRAGSTICSIIVVLNPHSHSFLQTQQAGCTEIISSRYFL